MDMDLYLEKLASWGPLLAWLLTGVVMILASGHVVLHKRDARSALGWVGIILLVPVVGALLYVVFGINRIRRRATRLRPRGETAEPPGAGISLPPRFAHLEPLARLTGRVARWPLLGGNRVTPLVNGEEAYPAMLAAIAAARRSIALSSFIFDHDSVGEEFAVALAAAVRRGVAVRVIIDAVGARYSWPSMVGALRRAGIPVARFLPTWVPWRLPYVNLRCHRKLLAVDGRLAFTGGLNIHEGHMPSRTPRRPVIDLHFCVEGPIVAQLVQAFAEDWTFVSRETLAGEAWFPALAPAGEVWARTITDGPDHDFEATRWILAGALASARSTVRIQTPYFLPDAGLVTELNTAALRGVVVDILLPEAGNLSTVQWASMAQLQEILEYGCAVRLVPPPFDHTKLLLVDELWSLIGSANWDPRSLRLNFELNLECYDAALAASLGALYEQKRSGSRRITLDDLNARGLCTKLRDGTARLVSPYL